MSVWFCIPSKRAPEEANACFAEWHRMGYKIAVMREIGDGPVDADVFVPTSQYRGWAPSVNHLAKFVLEHDPECWWIVTGGDDYYPDALVSAEEIAGDCEVHFSDGNRASTYGVMQPIGDDWRDQQGRIIERIAGSPWLGREWCKRAFQGLGPLPPFYYHNFADEELQLVAQRLGVFWQRPDLKQEHRHPVRKRGRLEDAPNWWRSTIGVPGLLDRERKVFEQRKAAGFPGSEPL